ncbi:MAG TPA: hypothetical protein VMB02_05675, partial [Candidatus Aquilonibacter sp.]|nr:hypothetical protein [Candidatus Aquilonibacter sp.]
IVIGWLPLLDFFFRRTPSPIAGGLPNFEPSSSGKARAGNEELSTKVPVARRVVQGEKLTFRLEITLSMVKF